MDLVLRSVVAFSGILFFTRIIGRRELASMEPFDLILLIVLGDLIQQGVTQNDFSVTGALIVISTISILTVIVSYANFRVRWLRPIFEGGPIILIENGQVIERNLRRERLTVEEVEAQARQQSIESIERVKWAVLERNGRISFIPA
jgi:uncharacterized membrane protein YcaP (DUF421 family)